MKVIFELGLEEKITNIGVAKALTETHLSDADLFEISKYLLVYCSERAKEQFSTSLAYEAPKGGGSDA